jgi:hypothetical protein
VMQRQLWRLQDLRDRGVFGFTVDISKCTKNFLAFRRFSSLFCWLPAKKLASTKSLCK